MKRVYLFIAGIVYMNACILLFPSTMDKMISLLFVYKDGFCKK